MGQRRSPTTRRRARPTAATCSPRWSTRSAAAGCARASITRCSTGTTPTTRSTSTTRCATTPRTRRQTAKRDIRRYVEYLHGQTRELLTRFGKIDILWFDFSPRPSDRFAGKGKDVWQSEKLLALVRELAPRILVNDRLEIDQDIKTPEQFMPREWVRVDGQPVVWEACQTFSGSWGYHRDEESWKSVEQLVQMLIDTVSKGGNLLLNVGPTGRGEIDDRALERLAGMGEWMRRHGRSIYGCTQAPADIAVSARTAASRGTRRRGGCTCTCSPGPSATSTSTGWPTGSSTRSC